MRIALFNQFFWPDTIATSQLLTDLARSLAKEHEVTAVCAATVRQAQEARWDDARTLSITRTRGLPFGIGSRSRVVTYLSYLAGAFWHGLWMPKPDTYVTLTTPPLLSVVGTVLSTLRNSDHLIWEMDVYPDIATDVGFFKKNGIIDRLSGAVLDWSRRRAVAIIVLGEDMKSRLLARGIPEDKIEVVDNWADGEEITPKPFPHGPLVIHYSGNLGTAHETKTISDVIGRLRNHPDFQFVFAGSGSKRIKIEEFCSSNGITNVLFRPYCSRAELGNSLADGHLGLVTQLPETVGSVVPSKIYGIMAAGRPLLYIGPRAATPARHIRRFDCGWHFEPGDVDGLEQLLIHLNRDRYLLSEAGIRARRAFLKNFDRRIGVAQVLRVLLLVSRVNEFTSTVSESARGD